MSFDDTTGHPGDSGGFDELPGPEDSRHSPHELMRIALGDVIAAFALIIATFAIGAWALTAGGLIGGVVLIFSIYLGVMALSGTWIALRNLSAVRRLQASGETMGSAPPRDFQRLEQLIAAAEHNPGSVLAQAGAAQQAWLERDFELAGRYARRADELHPGMYRMVMILMAVHWQRGEAERSQEQARRLLATRSSAGVVRKVLLVLTWPWLLLPSVRHNHWWMRANRRIDDAWEQWARWLVHKYEVRE